MWWRHIGLDIAAGALLVVAWYLLFRSFNRKRGTEVLQWIESAFEGHGFVSSVEWLSPSRLKVRLRLLDVGLLQPSMLIRLLPRETPLQWIVSCLRRHRETLTFQADLACAPNFNMEVQNHRWCGRTRRKILPNQNWAVARMGPFVITSRPDWQRDIRNMMDAIVTSRDCNFMDVRFRRTTPHFSATVPLTAIKPSSETAVGIFEALRDLAAGASASRF